MPAEMPYHFVNANHCLGVQEFTQFPAHQETAYNKNACIVSGKKDLQ